MPELTNQMSHVTNFSFSDCSIPAESQFLRLNFYRIWSRSKSQQLSWCPQDDVTTGSGSSTLRRLLLFKDKMQLEIFSISKSLFSFLPSLQKATVWSPYRLDFVMSDAYLKACPDEFFNNNVVHSYFIIHLFFFCLCFVWWYGPMIVAFCQTSKEFHWTSMLAIKMRSIWFENFLRLQVIQLHI